MDEDTAAERASLLAGSLSNGNPRMNERGKRGAGGGGGGLKRVTGCVNIKSENNLN